MFVLKSKYHALEQRLKRKEAEIASIEAKMHITQMKHSALLKEWNALINRINQKGGRDFLNNGVIPSKTTSGLSQEDIKRLLQLCHPDKHDGKQMASEMTAKLLALRK